MKEALAKISIAHWFLGIGLLFGLMTIYTTPPFQSPDETNHFHRAVDMSSGNLMGQHQGKRLGGVLPSAYLQLTMHFDSIRKNEGTFSRSYSPHDNFPSSEMIFVDYANVGYYAPTVYLPQTAGIVLAKIFGASPLAQLYAGRIYGFLFWLIIVFLAIRIIPSHKMMLAFLALLPASISINGMLSGDSVSNALIFLWIALVLRFMMVKVKMENIVMILLVIISLILTVNKLVYLPILFLVFLIPKERWPFPFAPYFLVGINMIMALLWASYGSSLFIPYDQYDVLFRDGQQLNPGVNPFTQLKYVLNHPFKFIQVGLISYVESGVATWAHYIGKFGWEKHYIPTWTVALLSLALIAQIFKHPTSPFSRKQWFWMIAIVVLMTISFTITIYMQWSPVGNERIWSLSGRYFIPIGALFFMACGGMLARFRCKDGYFLLINVVGLIMLQYSIITAYY